MAIIYHLSGKNKTNPIFSDWIMPGGSNPHSYMYTVETVEPTSYECVFDDDAKQKMKERTEKEGRRTLFVWIFVHLKALTMMAVVIAILAVDFPPIFYRTLCKTEELGISLMDTGVALITLNSGMSNVKARPWHKEGGVLQIGKDLLNSAQSVIFPIIVGSLRFCVISDLDMLEHPSEWGIHWNFYTTVACISLLQNFVIRSKFCITIGLTLMVSYQLVVTQYDLTEYIFHAPRYDFFSANREGIFSVVGYFSMQIIGVGLGRFLYTEMLDPAHLKYL